MTSKAIEPVTGRGLDEPRFFCKNGLIQSFSVLSLKAEPITKTNMSTPITHLLADYPIATEIPVRWSDLDALNHVNNTIYLRYFESARIDYFNRVGLIAHRTNKGVGPILHSVYCRFRIPVTFPDTVTVGVRVRNMQSDRFEMETAMVSHQHEKICAEGTCTVVSYDYKLASKAPIPEVLRQRMLELEGDALHP